MTAGNRVVFVDGVRTPFGRAGEKGMFWQTRADDLIVKAMMGLLERNPAVPVEEIDDVAIAATTQQGDQGLTLGRTAGILAGLPRHVPGFAIDRMCAGAMTAVTTTAGGIAMGSYNIVLAGGVEHMGHVPMNHGVDFHPGLANNVAKASGMMGLTAELLGKMHGISRQDQDEFGARSHRLAYEATLEGRFKNEILPCLGHDADGVLKLFDTDEVIRPETTVESLAALRPVFDPANGTVTAGTSSALSDGASAMLVMSEDKAKALGLKIRARVIGMGVAGCDPSIMGYGPVPASKKALKAAGLDIGQIDFFELNEAFAAQALPVMKDLGLLEVMDTKVNLNGGAIALGHPLGCSGSRISTTLINVLESKDARYGLATMCIGLGQGIATVFERVE